LISLYIYLLPHRLKVMGVMFSPASVDYIGMFVKNFLAPI